MKQAFILGPISLEVSTSYGDVTRLTQELGESVSYQYDDRGRLEKVINGRTDELVYLYEPWGGLKHLVYDSDKSGGHTAGERKVDYTYDDNGNVRTVSDGGAQLWDITYDALNRVDLATAHYISASHTLDSDYDRFGNRSTLTLTDGHAGTSPILHTWQYDSRERIKDLCAKPSSGTCTAGQETVRFGYFLNDDLQTLTHEKGANDLTTTLAYLAEGPIESITVGSAPLHKLAYAVDPILNVDTIDG